MRACRYRYMEKEILMILLWVKLPEYNPSEIKSQLVLLGDNKAEGTIGKSRYHFSLNCNYISVFICKIHKLITIKCRRCTSSPSNLALELTAPTPILLSGLAYSVATASTILAATLKRQSAVSAQNRRLLPKWSRMGADRSRRSTSLLNSPGISSQPPVAIVDSTSGNSHTMTY